MDSPKENKILSLSFIFALEVINYVEKLEKQKKFVIANQLLKSGTSIGANIREAQNGESKADFVHKLKVALKEADETEYWLLLCKHSNYENCDSLLLKIEEVKKVLGKIVATTKKQYLIH